MRAEITYNDSDKGSTTYRGIEAVHTNGDEAIIEDAGGTQVTETGVDFVHAYES